MAIADGSRIEATQMGLLHAQRERGNGHPEAPPHQGFVDLYYFTVVHVEAPDNSKNRRFRPTICGSAL